MTASSTRSLGLLLALLAVAFVLPQPVRAAEPAAARKLHIIVFGAHPDDAEFRAGGTGAKWAKLGHEVKLVSVTNGDIGHWNMAGGALAQRRTAESQAAAKRLGVASQVLDIHDGELEPNLENRRTFTRLIRRWNADIVIGHRPNDYHPDHRAAAQLVQDASYLIGVPLICPDTPIPKSRPVILLTHDYFRKPCAFSPDIALAIDDVATEKARLIACHESQFFEWLPYDREELGKVPVSPEARLKWLKVHYLAVNKDQAYTCRILLKKRYGAKSAKIKYAETFEVSEYGRQPGAEELYRLLPD